MKSDKNSRTRHKDTLYRSLAISLIAASAALVTVGAQATHPPRPIKASVVNMVQLSGETVTGPAFGASTLVRSIRDARGTVSLGDLDPGVVHSVWALAFNRPGKCVRTPQPICLPTQDGAESGAAAQLSIFWVGGGISDGSGVLNLAFELLRRRPTGFVSPAFQQTGLTNPLGAEIHFVVVPHPQAGAALDGPDGPQPGSVAYEMTHPGAATRGAVHLPLLIHAW